MVVLPFYGGRWRMQPELLSYASQKKNRFTLFMTIKEIREFSYYFDLSEKKTLINIVF